MVQLGGVNIQRILISFSSDGGLYSMPLGCFIYLFLGFELRALSLLVRCFIP
jgi:hypothetical protein